MRFWLDFIYLAPLWGEARQMWCFWRQMWSGACFPSVEPLQCLAGCQPGSASGGTEEAPVYLLCVCVCVSKAESVMCICCVYIHVWGLCGTVWNTLINNSAFTPSPSDISGSSNVTTHTDAHTLQWLPRFDVRGRKASAGRVSTRGRPPPCAAHLWCGLRSTVEQIRWVLMRDTVLCSTWAHSSIPITAPSSETLPVHYLAIENRK